MSECSSQSRGGSGGRSAPGSMNIIVLAKAPVAGRVKTRLCPPLTPQQAADVAGAALRDTLRAATAVRGARTVLVLDGRPGPWIPGGVRVIPQRRGDLDERIAAAFVDGGGPALLVGMDTPQVNPALLAAAIDTLLRPGVDAVLGEAADGGWWAAGTRHPAPEAFRGVPMSTKRTHEFQQRSLIASGLCVAPLPRLRDVDTIDDAMAVAQLAPGSEFARALQATAVVGALGSHT